jgi:hypothetical protein
MQVYQQTFISKYLSVAHIGNTYHRFINVYSLAQFIDIHSLEKRYALKGK